LITANLQAIDIESENLDRMLESELIVVDRLIDLTLQREWLRLIRNPTPLSESLIETVIGKRKRVLGIDNFSAEAITGIIRLDDEINLIDQQILDSSFIAESMFQVSFPPCSSTPVSDQLPESLLKKARRNNPDRNPAIVLMIPYQEHLNKCAERSLLIKNTFQPFTNPSDTDSDTELSTTEQGLIAQSLADWHQAKEQLNSERAQAVALKQIYDELSEQIDAAFDARETLEEPSTTELEALSSELRESLDSVASESGAFGLADASAERINQIDTLLSAIVNRELEQTPFESSTTYRSASVVAGLHSIKADVERLQEKHSLDPIAGLIIEKQRQIALRKLAADRISRQQNRVTLLRDRYQTIVEELEILRSIDNAANQEGVDELLEKPAHEVLTMRCRTIPCGELQRIILKYIASVDYTRRRLQHLDYYLIDLEHRAALEESATAVRLWHALIETPLTELATYHASGIKGETIADMFIRFSSLGAIAIGVND